MGDHLEKIAAVTVVRECSRIGHYSGIDALGHLLVYQAEITESTDEMKYQFRCRRRLGMRQRNRIIGTREGMMVKQEFLCFGVKEAGCNLSDTAYHVEIKTAEHIGLIDKILIGIGVIGKYSQILSSGKP